MTKIREQKARNQLKKHGFRLNKAPARHWTRAQYGVGYQLIAPTGFVIGANQREYEMSLAGVFEHIAWLARCTACEQLQAVRKEFFENGGAEDDWQCELKELAADSFVMEAA
ncbi:hypothetical protein [Nitrobacter sp. JJSN]|uniref:hypothetical protein n=1 Tax=Nitrobacter sp. JJSN TaxID=3453033 RepID=UPI003F76710C